MVVLGTGDPAVQDGFRALAARAPDRFAVRFVYDNALAHKIEAGSDIFLMPSRFEPCGLNQLYSLRYGTVPVVRAVGGLDDTIVDYDEASATGTGFKFAEYTPEALFRTLRRALATYQRKREWHELVGRIMTLDFSWNRSAHLYLELYRKLVPPAAVPASRDAA